MKNFFKNSKKAFRFLCFGAAIFGLFALGGCGFKDDPKRAKLGGSYAVGGNSNATGARGSVGLSW